MINEQKTLNAFSYCKDDEKMNANTDKITIIIVSAEYYSIRMPKNLRGDMNWEKARNTLIKKEAFLSFSGLFWCREMF